MKKTLLLSAMALAISASASAKTVDELRIYINPGHGSWTGNDRAMTIVGHKEYDRYATDTTNFFESNTNLRKGFAVLEKFVTMGVPFDRTLNQEGERWQIGAARDLSQNIVMSHVKCGPFHDDNGTVNQLKADGKPVPEDIEYYNRDLGSINAEVDANNFDVFISIHSNAATEGTSTNYPLYLYRGYDTPVQDEGVELDYQTASRGMATSCWKYSWENPHMGWTNYSATNMNVRGDINFYGSSSTNSRGHKGYLGVLKSGVPGFLVEGYFHTYQPARHRAMNWDVDYIEGAAYAHGLADYLGIAKEKTGDIYGIVRDRHEKFTHTYYKPNPTTDDLYLPINGAKAILKKGSEVVAEYTVDNNYNGAFVFKAVEPGDYTISFEAEGYVAPEPIEVTVTAANTAYCKAFMTSESWEAPTVEYVNYPDEFNIPSVLAADNYTFAAKYTDEPIAELAGKTVRRAILRGTNLYVLALDAENAATLVVINTTTHEVVATVSTEGMEGTELNCSDIQLTADGFLLASAKELTQCDDAHVNDGETRGEAWIYKWANDENGLPTGTPEPWISTDYTGNWYRSFTGETFAYTGTSDLGTATLSCQTASGVNMRTQVITVVNGEQAASNFHQPAHAGQGGYFSTEVLGSDYRFVTSPLNDGRYFVVGSGATVAMPEYEFTHTNGTPHLAQLADGIMDNATPRVGFFKHAGHSFMAFPDITEGKNLGIRLADITAGVAKATAVATVNTQLEESSLDNITAAGATIVTRDALDQVTDGYINLVLLRGDGLLSCFTTNGVQQPQAHAEMPYDIVLTEDTEGLYTVTFKATGAAPAAAVVLTSTTDPENVQRFEIGAVEKGENSYQFISSAIDEGSYTMAIELTNSPISRAGEYASSNNGVTKRGGVVAICDTDAPSFGYVAVYTGANGGVEIFNPEGVSTGTFFKGDSRFSNTNQSSPFRGDEREGKAVFTDWSDQGAGYWVLDPANPVELTQLVAGTKDGLGSYTYNGTVIGGGSSCGAFQGKGENTRFYSFLEDYPSGNMPGAQNYIYRYDIGAADQITTEPAKKFEAFNGAGLLANQNVEIKAVEQGFFAAQCRGAGNNQSGTPCFFFSDNEGNVLLNSAVLGDQLVSCNSAIAVNHDRTLLAVGQYTCASIFAIEWNGDKPELTKLYDIPTGSTTWAQYSFDYAGNLHAFERETGGYHAYALPAAAPVVSVPAPKQYVVLGSQVGVSDVAVEAPAAAPVFYNLNGVRMTSTQLTPGIYIRVSGGKAEKVVIR